jgi:hypothetical protein
MGSTPTPQIRAAVLVSTVLVLLAPLSAQVLTGSAVEEVKGKAPRVFLRSPDFDLSALPAAIGFISPAATLDEAQIAVEVSRRTEDGRETYEILFTGRGEFEGQNDRLTYAPEPGKTADEIRASLGGIIKLGLLRYASKTPIAGRLGVRLLDTVKPTSVVDPWHFWVFSLSAYGFLNGESSYRSQSLFGNFSANRTTPEWKIRLSLSGSSSRDVFSFEDYRYESSSESRNANGMAVKSLGEHWSVGGFVSIGSSTYSNLSLSWNPRLAVEYDLFRYSESTKRQLRFLYAIGPAWNRYHEETIYDKRRETLWRESLDVAFEIKQPWGSISASLEGSHYLHNPKYYRVELNGEVSVRIFQGLNFEIGGGGSRIHDQLFLPKGGATYEEVLLRRKQLETGYDYFLMVGMSYRFGSVRSNVVNPRFGSGDGGFSMSVRF